MMWWMFWNAPLKSIIAEKEGEEKAGKETQSGDRH